MAVTRMRTQHFVMALLMAMYLPKPSQSLQQKTVEIPTTPPIKLTSLTLKDVENALTVSIIVYTDSNETVYKRLGPFTVDSATKQINVALGAYANVDLHRIDYKVETVQTHGDQYSFTVYLGVGDCKTNTLGRTYLGKLSSTISGLTCQRWDSQSPHTHSFTASDFPDATLADAGNYCRNPDSSSGGPWCYTTDLSTKLEVCNLTICGTSQVIVIGDPHVAIPIPGSDYPLCYDITGYDGDVIEMLSVKDSGMVLNAKLIDPKHEPVTSKEGSEKLFVGQVAILLGNSYVFVSPKEIILKPTKTEQGFGWQDGIIEWSPPGQKTISLKVTSNRLSVPFGAGIRAIIHNKSKFRLDVSFANIYTGIKHEIDGMIGGVAFRVKGHQQFTMDDGSKGIKLNVSEQKIVLRKARIGKLECWKLHKPMERIFGDDVIALRRSCLFCRYEAKTTDMDQSKTNMEYANIFK